MLYGRFNGYRKIKVESKMAIGMVSLLGVLIVHILLLGCEPKSDKTEHLKVNRKVTELGNQDLAEVYSEIVNGDTAIPTEGTLVRIYSEYVSWDTVGLPSVLSRNGAETETIENFKHPNQPISIENIPFKFRTKSVLYFKNPNVSPEATWGEYPNKYFKRSYTFGFSKIGFNKSRNQAIVSVMEGRYGGGFGSGYTVILLKVNGRWKPGKKVSWWTI